jgi:hypothetical protein
VAEVPFLTYPEIKGCNERERYEQCFVHRTLRDQGWPLEKDSDSSRISACPGIHDEGAVPRTRRNLSLDGKPPYHTSIPKPWRQAVLELRLEPRPRFHDLRHTWKTNTRRSGMASEICESIIGNCYRGRTVNERYGRTGDEVKWSYSPQKLVMRILRAIPCELCWIGRISLRSEIS